MPYIRCIILGSPLIDLGSGEVLFEAAQPRLAILALLRIGAVLLLAVAALSIETTPINRTVSWPGCRPRCWPLGGLSCWLSGGPCRWGPSVWSWVRITHHVIHFIVALILHSVEIASVQILVWAPRVGCIGNVTLANTHSLIRTICQPVRSSLVIRVITIL